MAAMATPMASPSSAVKVSGHLTDPNGVPTGQASLPQRGVGGGPPVGGVFKTIGEVVKAGSEPRKLARFEQAERDWVEGLAALSRKTGRPPHELHTASAAHEWRQKKEALDALERAMPIQDRIGGEDAYVMSLRDAWERIIPIGGQFSGLSAVIKDNKAST